MRLPPSWRLVGRARARLIGRARARLCAGCCGIGGVVAGVLGALCRLLRGLSVSVARLWCFGDARQTHIMERFTGHGSNALDSEALH